MAETTPGTAFGSETEETEYDVVVLGSGSAGVVVSGETAKAGLRVAVVEPGLVGGECPYVACIPSKALLLAARRHRANPDEHHAQAWRRAVVQRDEASQHRSDARAVRAMEKKGITLLRGRGRVTEDGVVSVSSATGDTSRVRWRRALVVATGAQAVVPPIEGLADVPMWNSEQALSSDELPERLLVLGGGAIGTELAQVYSSFGVQVGLVESAPTLLPQEAPWVGEMITDALRAGGVDVRTGTTVTKAVRENGSGAAVLHCDDGAALTADRVLVAVGKAPVTGGLGLDVLGVSVEAGDPPEIDDRCRVLAGDSALDTVFAIGDVTGLAPYTHAANYQGRVVAAHLLGRGYPADLTGSPRVVYSDPPVFCAGETETEARARGVDVVTASFDVTRTSRAGLERRTSSGEERQLARLELVAARDGGVLLGISAVGPEADSWAAELAFAVRRRVTVAELADVIHAFPTWAEAIHIPARELADRLRG